MSFSIGDSSVQNLMRSLRERRVLFFAGAGISHDSGLPIAKDLIRPVVRHFFPHHLTTNESGYALLEEPATSPGASHPLAFADDILPEAFYSMLLELVGPGDETKCISMFDCLRPHPSAGFLPEPTFVHLFIVLYAYENGLPVFTVNFDPLFELACKELGLRYRVYSYGDKSRYERDQEGRSEPCVCICKAHGTVGMSDEPLSLDMIKTTENAIAEPNDWASLIERLMRDHDLALVGYSGRDVDLFPTISATACSERRRREKAGHGEAVFSPLFWFNKFEGCAPEDAEMKKSEESRATKIDAFPNLALTCCLKADEDVLPVSTEALLETRRRVIEAAGASRSNEDRIRMSEAFERVSEICGRELPTLDEDFLYLETLVRWQRNLSARIFWESKKKTLRDVAARNDWQEQLQKNVVRISREVGNYRAYTLESLRLVRSTRGWLGSEFRERRELYVHARLELISSFQMRIPGFDTSVVGYAPWVIVASALLCLMVEAGFWLLRLRVVGRGRLGDSAFSDLYAVHELENRHLALEFRMAVALGRFGRLGDALMRPLERRLLDLGNLAVGCTNLSTIKGVVRRIGKLGLDKAVTPVDAEDGVRSDLAAFYAAHRGLFDTSSDVSQETAMNRDAGGLKEAIESYEQARWSGNTLGDLKTLVIIVSRGVRGGSDVSSYHRQLETLIHDRNRCDGLNILNRAHVNRFLRMVRLPLARKTRKK